MTPQLIMLAFVIIGLVTALNKHGEPRAGKHNFPATAAAIALGQSLLYWGGFYDELLRRLFS